MKKMHISDKFVNAMMNKEEGSIKFKQLNEATIKLFENSTLEERMSIDKLDLLFDIENASEKILNIAEILGQEKKRKKMTGKRY